MDHVDLAVLRAHVEDALPEYLRDLERLVNVDCGSYTKVGVDEVGRWAEQRLAELGASVVRHANAELGDTIVGTFERDQDGPTVLMIGHLDTVFEPGTVAQRPFSVRDGRAYGPGVSDMKAGLLTGMYALSALRAVAPGTSSGCPWLPVGRLVFVVNPDEEIGSPLSEPIIREHAAVADFALVLEAARENGDIVSARKGQIGSPSRDPGPGGTRRRGAREGTQCGPGGCPQDRRTPWPQRALPRRDRQCRRGPWWQQAEHRG